MSVGSTAASSLSPHVLVDPLPSGRRAGPADQAAPIREVLACVDGSKLGSSVLRHARLVANALDAKLTLLHVLEADAASGDVPTDPLAWGIRQREARVQLDRLAADADLPAGSRSELIQGRAPEQICRWAARHNVDLTVLCSHGASGMTEWDLASTARKLVDRIPGSLLLVPALPSRECSDDGYRRILVPLDGSIRAESVVPVAMRIAMQQNAEVCLAHAVPTPGLTRTGTVDAEGVELEQRVIERNHRVADQYLDRLRARLDRSGARIRTRVVGDGNVAVRLERLIREERAELVVMSAHGHDSRADCSCGSTTEHVLTHAAVPVLVIRDRSQIRRLPRTTPRRIERLPASAGSNPP